MLLFIDRLAIVVGLSTFFFICSRISWQYYQEFIKIGDEFRAKVIIYDIPKHEKSHAAIKEVFSEDFYERLMEHLESLSGCKDYRPESEVAKIHEKDIKIAERFLDFSFQLKEESILMGQKLRILRNFSVSIPRSAEKTR